MKEPQNSKSSEASSETEIQTSLRELKQEIAAETLKYQREADSQNKKINELVDICSKQQQLLVEAAQEIEKREEVDRGGQSANKAQGMKQKKG